MVPVLVTRRTHRHVGLLAWYDANKRDLPWRRDTDPYRVLVSEAMLQQTRAETVLRYYEPWLAKWPNVEALAAATDEAVHAMWSGLGYYRRARNLHAAAKQIAAHGWPDDLTQLPGVGAYTAAAVSSIAFGQPVAVVDGNVERVMSRIHDVEEDVTRAAGKRTIGALAQAALDVQRPGDWNQAVMELGATICTPTPRCEACPIVSCQANDNGTVAQRPVKPAKRAPEVESVRMAYHEHDGHVVLVRRESGLLAGTWGLPETQETGPVLGRLEHKFTHRTWHIEVVAATAKGTLVPLDALDEYGLSTAARKAIAVAQRST